MKIGEILQQYQRISSLDVARALQAQKEMGGLFGHVLINLGLVSEIHVLEALSQQLDLPLFNTQDYPEEPLELQQLSLPFLKSNQVVPVRRQQNQVIFAALSPQDPYIQQALSLANPQPIALGFGTEADINAALEKYARIDSDDDLLEQPDQDINDDEFVEHLKDLASEAPVIKIVNQLFHHAIDVQASDIHIEPFEQSLIIRFRVDGILQELKGLADFHQAAAIISRVKLLANLNIAERRLPQDGRIMTRIKGHELDLRVSSVPTVYGESLVMRVLDRGSIELNLLDMGFNRDLLLKYQSLLHRPHGILLVTGPTGSGKTTTLYASLASLNRDIQKVITVEDPVEYQLDGINQIQVQPQINLTFAKALRSILRQDPDIIMIGEMRDTETANIAVQSALTGHLVLSTLHTNTAAGAITRLSDMGVERYLITSSVNAVLSQRLVRKLCTHCREPVDIETLSDTYQTLKALAPTAKLNVYKGVGCSACQQSGYAGRTSIHELLILSETLQRAIMQGQDAISLHQLARTEGMRTLYEDGLFKVAQGITSLEEILRITQDQILESRNAHA